MPSFKKSEIIKQLPAVTLLVAAGAMVSSSVLAAEYSPPVAQSALPNQLLWGDTHLHTRMSADAYMSGAISFTPEMAYRFASGQRVTSSSGIEAQLREPLDFLVVSDHSEFLGLFAAAADRDEAFLATELGAQWDGFLRSDDMPSMFKDFQSMVIGGAPDRSTEETKRTVWREFAETADQFNQPGVFTALIGYEWSSTIEGSNLHRNVIFRDGVDKAAAQRPFSSVDSQDPEKLWDYMARYEETTGGQVLAIPHNGNLSNGLMFSLEDLEGRPITIDYVTKRARWEPVYEVTQIKGDGEAHPKLSPEDPYADYETWDTGNFPVGDGAVPKTDAMLPHEYARSALKMGLKVDSELGGNPFAFGMIGSTDAHTGLSAVEEDNFFGKFPESEPNAKRAVTNMDWLQWPNAMLTSSGLAAVWATENTREGVFDAIKRKEVYATTGPRIGLRVFGGWNFAASDVLKHDFHVVGYARGVPMGGELSKAKAGQAPTLMIMAQKAANGANLDRVQVVKGWLDAQGDLHEKIYDVAIAPGAVEPGSAGTVDIDNATYTNSIGSAQLATVWKDPEFSAAERAFYYVRVLEIPTPRWTAVDAEHFGTSLNAGTETTTQERAYGSPIWYQP